MPAPDPWAYAADLLDPPIDPYIDDPAAWARERAKAHPWSKQVEILESVRDHRKTAVKACHGPGKSFIAAHTVGWWGDVHPAGTVAGVTTAPTAPQVSKILWKELRRVHKVAELDGRIIGGNGQDEWKEGDETIAFGRKPADHDKDGFQGIHEDYVLVVLDEACGIPKSLWTATDTLVTNADSRILAIGNPDHPLSEFAEICRGAPEDGSSGWSRAGWWVITIGVFDTPNFTGEWVPPEVAKKLPSRLWLDEVTAKWGKGSPLYVSKVLGEFPDDASDGTIPWSWLQNCRGEEATAKIGPLRVPVELGVDVGGSDNGDETVIVRREGQRVAGEPRRIQTGDSEVVVDAVIAEIKAHEVTSVKVDSIGVGHGVVGSLRRRVKSEVRHEVAVHAVNVGEAATQPERFWNLKAEIWWEVGREYSRLGLWDLTELDDEVILELSEPRYVEVNGKIRIESKPDVKKRIGRSTDNADAVLLAFYEPTPEFLGGQSSYKIRRRGR